MKGKVICIGLAFVLCLCALPFSVSASSGPEANSYTDFFDSDFTATYALATSVYAYDASGSPVFKKSFYNHATDASVASDCKFVFLTSAQVSELFSALSEFYNATTANYSVTVFSNVEVISKSHSASSGFPYAASVFNLTGVGCSVAYDGVLPLNDGNVTSPNVLSYKVTFPSPLSGSDSGCATINADNEYFFYKSISASGGDNVWFSDSAKFQFTTAIQQYTIVADLLTWLESHTGSAGFLTCTLFNTYQYLLPAATEPWEDVKDPVVTTPTFTPSDDFESLIDDKASGADSVVKQLMQMPINRYITSLSAVGIFLTKFFDDVGLIKDLSSFWAYFAMFNMLLGTFIVGVRSLVSNLDDPRPRSSGSKNGYRSYRSYRSGTRYSGGSRSSGSSSVSDSGSSKDGD